MTLGTLLLVVLAATARGASVSARSLHVEKESTPIQQKQPIIPQYPAGLLYQVFLDRHYIFYTLQTLTFKIQSLERQQLLLLTALRCSNITISPSVACKVPSHEPQPTTTTTTITTPPSESLEPSTEEQTKEEEENIVERRVRVTAKPYSGDFTSLRPETLAALHVEPVSQGETTGVSSDAATSTEHPEGVAMDETNVSNPEAVVKDETYVSNPEAVAMDETYVSNPEAVVLDETYVSNPEAVVLDETYVRNPEAVVLDETYVSNPETIAKDETYVNNPETIAKDETYVSKPEGVVLDETSVSNPEDIVKDKIYVSNREDIVKDNETPVVNHGVSVTAKVETAEKHPATVDSQTDAQPPESDTTGNE